MNHIIRSITAAVSLSLIGGVAKAQMVELQQSSPYLLPSGSYADNYYIGGNAGNSYTSGPITGYPNAGVGPNLGFTFSSNADVQSAGSNAGKFQNLPTDPTDHNTQVLYFSALGGSSTTDTLNFAAGFTGVTFNYSLGNNNSSYAQTADVWSGLNGTGTIIGTISLGVGTLASTQALNSAATTLTFSPAAASVFTAWSQATANNFSGSGIGQSVTFGVANTLPSEELEIDAFTVAAVPEPSTWALALIAIAALAYLRRRGFRA